MNLNRSLGVFFRYYHILFRGAQSIADLFYWPLVDILLWGLTSIWIQSQQSVPNLPLMLMTGLVFWQITYRGSCDVAVNIVQEFWNRNLVNLFSTPLTLFEWGVGIIMLCFFKLLISLCFGIIVVYLLFSLNIFTLGWAFLPFAVSLLIFGWTMGFFASSFIIYYGQQLEVLAWSAGFIFAPFSAVFFPASILPVWAQGIAWSLPTTYIFEGMRQILNHQPFPMSYFWISLGLNIFYLVLSFWFFSFMFKKSLAKGLARLE